MTWRKNVLTSIHDFSLWMKRMRRIRGMTLREVSEISGVSQSMLSDLENGVVITTNVARCIRISRALGFGIILVDVKSKYGMESDMIRNRFQMGSWMREIRKRRGLYQRDVIDISGVSKLFLVNMEGAKRNSNLMPFFKVLKALGYGMHMEEL